MEYDSLYDTICWHDIGRGHLWRVMPAETVNLLCHRLSDLPLDSYIIDDGHKRLFHYIGYKIDGVNEASNALRYDV